MIAEETQPLEHRTASNGPHGTLLEAVGGNYTGVVSVGNPTDEVWNTPLAAEAHQETTRSADVGVRHSSTDIYPFVQSQVLGSFRAYRKLTRDRTLPKALLTWVGNKRPW